MKEFHKLLIDIEKHPAIIRIIPGRVSRQQKWSSQIWFKISYCTTSGLKCLMTKWATAQELFVICSEEEKENIKLFIQQLVEKWI